MALVTPEAHTGLLISVSLGKGLIQSGASLVNYIDFDPLWIGRQEFLPPFRGQVQRTGSSWAESSPSSCWGPPREAGPTFIPLLAAASLWGTQVNCGFYIAKPGSPGTNTWHCWLSLPLSSPSWHCSLNHSVHWNTHHLANTCPQRVCLPLHLPPVPPPAFPSKLIYRLRSHPCSCPRPPPAAVRPRLCVTGTATSPASLFHLSPTAYRTSQNHGISRLERDPEISQSSPLLLICFCCCSVTGPLRPRWLQHTRLLCSPVSPRVRSNSGPLSRWYYPNISFSSAPFSSCLQTFPAFRVFSNESALHIRWPKYWSFSISSSNEYSGLISFRIKSFDLAMLLYH